MLGDQPTPRYGPVLRTASGTGALYPAENCDLSMT